ncbi:hypothetical protein O0I10_004451 [Lichtheimia ornata]|uniref:Uncharacterized protein n=1 Tax=Lichtheimia ornata TaxID=688661 RepID=A0AAD7Y0I4_9FUNG|nr:uncharacterized protein O0I10_004451 [Lichtheimia ornata]KAJ8659858.1 hypothetical protein O0I10_004451 [Lichtheimia ornata]
MRPYSIVFATTLVALFSQPSLGLICGCAEGDTVCTDACVADMERCVVECGITSKDCYKQCARRLVPPKIVEGIQSVSSIAEKIASVSSFLADPTAAVQSIASDMVDDIPEIPDIPNVIHEIPLPTPKPFPLPAESDDGDDDDVSILPFPLPDGSKPSPSILPFPLPDGIKPTPSILPFPLPDDDKPSPSDTFPNPLPKPADNGNDDDDEDCDDDEEDDYDNWDDEDWDDDSSWDKDESKTIKGLPQKIPSSDFDLPDIDVPDLPDILDNIKDDDNSRDIPSIKDLLMNMPKGVRLNHDLIEQYLRHAATTTTTPSPLADESEEEDKIKDLLQDVVADAAPSVVPKDLPLDHDLLDHFLPKPAAAAEPSSVAAEDKFDEDKLKDMIQDLVDEQGIPDVPLNALPSDIPLDALPSGIPLDALPSDIPKDEIPSDLPAGYAKSSDEDDDEDDEDCDDDEDDDDDDEDDHKHKMGSPQGGIPTTPIVDPVPADLPTGSNMPVPDALPSDIADALPSDLPAPYADAASDAAKLVAPANSQQSQSTVTAHTTVTSHIAAPSLGMLHASGSAGHDENHDNGAVSDAKALTIVSSLAMVGTTLVFFQL